MTFWVFSVLINPSLIITRIKMEQQGLVALISTSLDIMLYPVNVFSSLEIATLQDHSLRRIEALETMKGV